MSLSIDIDTLSHVLQVGGGVLGSSYSHAQSVQASLLQQAGGHHPPLRTLQQPPPSASPAQQPSSSSPPQPPGGAKQLSSSGRGAVALEWSAWAHFVLRYEIVRLRRSRGWGARLLVSKLDAGNSICQ